MQTELEHPEDALPDDFVDGMLTRKEAAGYLAGIGVSRTIATLARLYSTTDDGPPCIHRGRIPVYPKRALHEWAMHQLSRVRRRARVEMSGAPMACDQARPQATSITAQTRSN